MIVSDRLAEPFQHGDASFVHGFTWSGHPVSCAVALKSIEIMENEKVLENVLDNEDYFRQSLLNLKDIPIVGDVRGTGYFWGVELVKNQVTKETWAGEDAERLLRGYVSPEMFRRGLICRSDDRGDPVVQLAAAIDLHASRHRLHGRPRCARFSPEPSSSSDRGAIASRCGGHRWNTPSRHEQP